MDIAVSRTKNLIGTTLLITGCCIGAGMIGLPVMSAAAGFIPTTLAMVLCYFFATGTGLLLLEATLWFDERVNLLTMAQFALGKYGKLITGLLFLFLFYCLSVAYIDAGGALFGGALSMLFQYPVERVAAIACFIVFVGAIIYGGIGAASRINTFFLFGLAVTYCVLLSLGLPHVKSAQLLNTDWKAALYTLPILLICFGFQNLVPTLVYYAKKDVSVLRTAIFVGNLIPFLIYFLWNFVILGILPDDTALLQQAKSQGSMVTHLLEKVSESPLVLLFANLFSFFALLTSFVPNLITFVDFLKDGLKTRSYVLIYLLVLLPPTLFTLTSPHLFLKSLSLAGGFADVLLFGVLPVCIVWVGRYVKKIEGAYKAPGGKAFLVAILLFSIGMLCIK